MIFSFSVALLILLILIGVMIDVLLTDLNNTVPSRLGAMGGCMVFVPLWYQIIRKNKPVWQPGRRYWYRWLWLILTTLIVTVTEIGMGLPLLLIGLGFASFIWFVIDAFKNPTDFRVTKTAIIEE